MTENDTPLTDTILVERFEFDKKYRDPHISAQMESRVILDILESIGDNHEKKLKFLVHLLYEKNLHTQDLRYQISLKEDWIKRLKGS